MELHWRRATLADLEALVRSRVEVLRAANGLPETEDMTRHADLARDYYRQALAEDSHVAYLVCDGDRLAGAGGVTFYRMMPTYHKPVGYRAYILNMYTHPDYRRRGVARQTLEYLLEESRTRGVDRISLEATDMGRPLYESMGFTSIPGEMYLPAL